MKPMYFAEQDLAFLMFVRAWGFVHDDNEIDASLRTLRRYRLVEGPRDDFRLTAKGKKVADNFVLSGNAVPKGKK